MGVLELLAFTMVLLAHAAALVAVAFVDPGPDTGGRRGFRIA